MAKRGKVRPDRKHNFHFLGLMKCASCDCSITAQYAKGNGGIYTYYRCTKKRGACQEKYLGENQLVEQIKNFLKKVSLSSQDIEKVLAALDNEEVQAKEQARDEGVNLKEGLVQVETKLQKLLDVYLDDALTQQEYVAKKDTLISQKVALNKKITDFEQKGVSWLEPYFAESGISFCPEKSLRFGRRAKRGEPFKLAISYMVYLYNRARTFFERKLNE